MAPPKRKPRRPETPTPSALFSDARRRRRCRTGAGPARKALVIVFLAVAVVVPDLASRLVQPRRDGVLDRRLCGGSLRFPAGACCTSSRAGGSRCASRRRRAPASRVDVFVTTVHEPVDMLRRTLLAARSIDYPHQTWLLDDGDRAEMRRLAAELAAATSRARERRRQGAGCLNNALQFSTAEFVAAVRRRPRAGAATSWSRPSATSRDPRSASCRRRWTSTTSTPSPHRRERARRLARLDRSVALLPRDPARQRLARTRRSAAAAAR